MMSDVPEPIDAETAELITKNLDLAFAFIREVIADPTRLDDIPASGSIVVMLPPDDPELAATNLAIAERLRAEGKTVIVKQVGVEPITAEGWARLNAKIPAWAPVWATDLDPEAATVVYDQGRDALSTWPATGGGGGDGRRMISSIYCWMKRRKRRLLISSPISWRMSSAPGQSWPESWRSRSCGR